MKVVVTGGNGALGRCLVAALEARGDTVLSLDRTRPPEATSSAWAADLREPGVLFEAVAGAEGVVHLAAHVAPNRATDCETFNDNTSMTYNVLRASAAGGVKRCVLASSVAVYGSLYAPTLRPPQYLPVDEDHPCAPVDAYGLSKVVAERLADAFVQSGALSIASLRLPGINFDPSFARIAQRMRNPAQRAPGFWSYVDVRDAVAAFVLALNTPFVGHRAFNIAAADSNMRESTLALAAHHFPGLADLRCRDRTNWSGVSSVRAEVELGFRAHHVWKTALQTEAG